MSWLGGEPRHRSGRLAVFVAHRKRGKPICPYPEVVEEALCFGWIDSTVNPPMTT